MSGQLLDVFAIAFNSDNLKDFQEELKRNEKELDTTEKKVKKLEDSLKKLEKTKGPDSDEYKAVKQELEQAQKQAEKFKATIANLKGDSKYTFMQMSKSLGNIAKQLGLLVFVGATVKKSLDFYEKAEELDNLSKKTSIATDKLQQLGRMAERYGGSTEMTADSIVNLRTVYGQNASPDEMLEKVAQKMSTLKTDAEKWNLADSLGVDEATTRLLIEGVGKYREELQKADKYRMFTPEDIQRMRKYRHIQQDIKYGIENIQAVIARFLLPILTAVGKVIRSITNWFTEHEGAVKIIGVFIGIAAAVGAVILAVNLLNLAFKFLVANPVVLTIMAIIAVITLLVAVIQDFVVFLQGGESIIGDILKKMGFNVDEVRQNCLNFFQSLKEWIMGAIDWLKSLGGKFVDLAQKIKSMWDSLPEPIKKLIGMTNPISGVYTIATTAKEAMDKANSNPANAVPNGVISNYNQSQSINENNNNNARNINTSNKKSVNINKVEIVTKSTDAKGIAREMKALGDLDNGLRN